MPYIDILYDAYTTYLANKSRHLSELTHEPAKWSWDTGQWTAVN